MEVHPAEIVIAIQIVQSAAAMVLAGLLLYFFNTFRHAFLHHWACSSLALAMYLGASAAALGLYWAGPDYEFVRFLCSGISLGAAYPHVVWLMIGTWEAVHQRTVSRRFELSLIGGAALFGILSAAIGSFDPQAAELRSLLRVEIRYLLTGLAFLTAGVLLWRAQRGASVVGARIGAIGKTPRCVTCRTQPARSTRCSRWECAWRWTISAPATAAWPTSSSCRWT